MRGIQLSARNSNAFLPIQTCWKDNSSSSSQAFRYSVLGQSVKESALT